MRRLRAREASAGDAPGAVRLRGRVLQDLAGAKPAVTPARHCAAPALLAL